MDILFIILFALFFIGLASFVFYCVKGGNLIIGFLVTAAFWTLLAITYQLANQINAGEINSFGDGWNEVIGILNYSFNASVIAYGQVAATIILASWFGRVIVDTGIAKAIIKKVVELSGDKQMLTVTLISVVTALIFTSVFGPGSVIAMGIIVLPIFFSIGINKKVAIGSFIMAIAAGTWVNPGLTSQFTGNNLFVDIMPSIEGSFALFGWTAFLVHIVILCAFIFVNMLFSKDKVSAWAMSDDAIGKENEQISGLAYLVPFFPALFTLLIMFINLFRPEDAQLANLGVLTLFLIGIFFGLLFTKSLKSLKKATEVVQKTLHNGITDVGLLLGMLLALQVFIFASRQTISPLFAHVVGDSLDGLANHQFLVVLTFIALAPLALFRGPLTFFGAGAAFASVLVVVLSGAGGDVTAAGSTLVLLLFFVPSIAINVQICPTQSWVLWTVQYSKEEPNMLIKNYLVWAWLSMAAIMLLGYIILL